MARLRIGGEKNFIDLDGEDLFYASLIFLVFATVVGAFIIELNK